MKLSAKLPVLPRCSAAALEQVTHAYLECAEWADKQEGTSPRFPASQVTVARAVCAAFIDACGPLFELSQCLPGYSLESFGHDLWLTRSGHGAGFWDRVSLDCIIGEEFTVTAREGKTYSIDAGTELGTALTYVSYGDGANISPFAYPSLTQYRGWLYFDDIVTEG